MTSPSARQATTTVTTTPNSTSALSTNAADIFILTFLV
jgi:hypothetical protein